MAFGTLRPLLGKLTTITITPQNVSSVGVYTDNTLGALPFKGKIEEDSFSETIVTRNFSSVNSWNENPVPLEYSAIFSVTEVMMAVPFPTSYTQLFGVGNVLEKATRTSLYHKFIITMVDSIPTVLATWTIYAELVNKKTNRPKAKNLMTCDFRLVAIGDGAGGYISNPQIT